MKWLYMPANSQEPPNTIIQPVIADAVAQMLDKLIQNAADFAQPGTPVTVSLFTSGRSIRVAVENKGVALAPDIASGLFGSMVSSRRDGADHGIHLGLGLYIVRLIAEFHEGTVSASNLADGSGVRFEVSMFAPTFLR